MGLGQCYDAGAEGVGDGSTFFFVCFRAFFIKRTEGAGNTLPSSFSKYENIVELYMQSYGYTLTYSRGACGKHRTSREGSLSRRIYLSLRTLHLKNLAESS